tara:strand:+ start:55 stop:321 length:267 start_codon:yes stop_codon:yes gene_type:complete
MNFDWHEFCSSRARAFLVRVRVKFMLLNQKIKFRYFAQLDFLLHNIGTATNKGKNANFNCSTLRSDRVHSGDFFIFMIQYDKIRIRIL